VGVGLWWAGGIAAWIVARIVPWGRRGRWLAELLIAVAAALLLGTLATVLDFGGWKDLDWRAGLFTFAGALALVGCFRLVTVPRVQ
jgi:hypothetical protein